MLNFLYENYPYGKAEAFVEYEMRELANSQREEFTVYVLRGAENSTKRFVPENANIVPIGSESYRNLISAFLKLFTKSSLREIFYVLNKRPKEGVLRCLSRIYRYQIVAVGFKKQYKKIKSTDSKDVFVSYWLNECAFALTELKEKFSDIKIASRGHGFDVYEERCYLPFRKDILSGLDKIFLINKASKEYFEDRYGEWLDTSKIEISHLGVDLPTKIPKKSCDTPFRIVTCSTVIPLKRLDLMVDALSLIKDKKIEWVHFGGGPLLEEIKTLAKQKLAETSVKYVFKGQTPLNEVHKYYAQTPINLFVNCSDTEGTPVSVMEAMSYGIPAIARNVGGMAEVLDNSCGILLPKEESAELLKDAIEKIYLLSEQEYSKISQNAANKIAEEFDASKNFKNYIKSIISF